MRNLTVKREKSFVACLATMKVYIEDAAQGDLTVGNTSYRMLGTLKNGAECTFSIGDTESSIILIADKLSKNYCNDIYRIPAGTEDVTVSGKNVLNPATGNAFRFNGQTDPVLLQNRRTGRKRGSLITAACIVIGVAAGLILVRGVIRNREAKPETFTVSGMTITMTDAFKSFSEEGYTACYDAGDMAAFMLKEEFTLLEGLADYTLEDYGALLKSANGFDDSVVLKYDGELYYFEYPYTNPESNESYRYFSVLYKAPDAFWIIQFVTLDESYAKFKPDFIEWANSVTFETP